MKKKTVKKTKARKSALRFLVFGITCITLSCGIIFSVSKLWTQIYGKYKEKQELDSKLSELKQKEKDLSVDVEKMQDPEYVARYLREKYFYSKSDEYIIRIPEK